MMKFEENAHRRTFQMLVVAWTSKKSQKSLFYWEDLTDIKRHIRRLKTLWGFKYSADREPLFEDDHPFISGDLHISVCAHGGLIFHAALSACLCCVPTRHFLFLSLAQCELLVCGRCCSLPQCELYEEGVTSHFIPLVAPIFGARQLLGLQGSLRGWDGCRAINTLGDRLRIRLMLQSVVSLHSNSLRGESAKHRPAYVTVKVSVSVVFPRVSHPTSQRDLRESSFQ